MDHDDRPPPDDELPDRLSGVLAVVYLIFNECWSASGGDRLVRGELCAEAIRLGRLLVRLMPDDPEVAGLLALMLLRGERIRHGHVLAAGSQPDVRDDVERRRVGAQLEHAADLELERPRARGDDVVDQRLRVGVTQRGLAQAGDGFLLARALLQPQLEPLHGVDGGGERVGAR